MEDEVARTPVIFKRWSPPKITTCDFCFRPIHGEAEMTTLSRYGSTYQFHAPSKESSCAHAYLKERTEQERWYTSWLTGCD